MKKTFSLLISLMMVFGMSNIHAQSNILFCIADDASFEHFGANGCSWVSTPTFDEIAQNGIRFTHCYTTNSKCTPSRTSVLTGKYSWSLDAGANLYCTFPSDHKSVVEVLKNNNYNVGFTGKGWGPGDNEGRNLTGKNYNKKYNTKRPTSGIKPDNYPQNFKDFMFEYRNSNNPFFFWYGGWEPHRVYEWKSGAAKGRNINEIDEVPAFWPDNNKVRHDMLDYGYEIEYFDEQLGLILNHLRNNYPDKYNNTIIIVTSDNAMPFPRQKGYSYEYSTHMPLVIMSPNTNIIKNAGRVVHDYVSFVDFAPTFLDYAGVGTSGMQPMQGISLRDIFSSNDTGYVTSYRDAAIFGRENNDVGRPNNYPGAYDGVRDDWSTYDDNKNNESNRIPVKTSDAGYPVRGIVKGDYSYIYNMEPSRLPMGNPETGYLDCDSSVTKQLVIDSWNTVNDKYFQWNCGLQAEEQLFNIVEDPYCINNLAHNSNYAAIKAELKERLLDSLTAHNDERKKGNGKVYDNYRRVPLTWQDGYYYQFVHLPSSKRFNGFSPLKHRMVRLNHINITFSNEVTTCDDQGNAVNSMLVKVEGTDRRPVCTDPGVSFQRYDSVTWIMQDVDVVFGSTTNYKIEVANKPAVYRSIQAVNNCGPSHTITASAGSNGTITPSGNVTVSEGANRTFTFEPDLLYKVQDVKVDNASIGVRPDYTFTNVIQNHTIDVSFIEQGPIPVPGIVQAEEFDLGAYYDTDPENKGDAGLRTNEGVDIDNKNDTICLGWCAAGEWTEYTIDVAQGGDYKVWYSFSTNANANPKSFSFDIDGNGIGTVNIASNDPINSVGNTVFEIRELTTISLTAGIHTLRWTAGSNAICYDYVEFEYMGGENIPPTISLTAPSNGSSFTDAETINFAANAFDADGSVAQVEFFANGNSIATDNSAPYTATSQLAAGNYTITAVATDDANASTTSTAVSITVTEFDQCLSNTAPSITISSPSNGADFVVGTVVSITAAVSDNENNESHVEFFVDGSSVGVDNSAPYSANYTMAAGNHDIYAIATDICGANTTSATVAIVEASVPIGIPVPGIAQAEDFDVGAYYDTDPENKGDAGIRTDEGVDIDNKNGIICLGWCAAGEWTEYTLDVAQDGDYKVWYSFSTNANANPKSFSFDIDGSEIGTVNIASNDPINSVGNTVFEKRELTTISLTAGTHTLRWTAGSNAICYDYAEFEYMGANIPPSISLTAPSNGSSFTDAENISFAANASDSDGSVTQVEFFANGNSIGIDNSSPYTANSQLAAGNYTITAVATDDANATTTSSAASITVTVFDVCGTNVAPVVTLTAPTNGSDYADNESIAFAANASDSDGSVTQVEFFANGISIGVDNAAPFTLSTQLAAGNYTITSEATDDCNATTTSASVAITVTEIDPCLVNVAPDVYISSPVSGAEFMVGSMVSITAPASDSDGNITQVEFFVDGISIGIDNASPYNGSYVMTAGSHDIYAVATDNCDVSVTSPTITIDEATAPIGIPVPGIAQAEDFDIGAYYDTDAVNKGDAGIRTDEGVDIDNKNGIICIGWCAAGEWTEYTIDVAQDGNYKLWYSFSTNANANPKSFSFSIDGSIVGTANIASNDPINSVGNTVFERRELTTVSLTAGTHTLRWTAGSGAICFDYAEFEYVDGNNDIYYYITNKKQLKNIQASSNAAGADLIQSSGDTGGDDQQWIVENTSGDYFYLKNKQSGHYMSSENSADGATVVQIAQSNLSTKAEWTTSLSSDGSYVFLVNRASGKHIRPNTADVGSPIVTQPNTWTGAWTRWLLVDVSTKAARQDATSIATVDVFPNPANSVLNILLSEVSNASVELYNFTGQRVLYKSIENSTTTLDVENIERGFYIVLIKNNNVVTTKQIILQ